MCESQGKVIKNGLKIYRYKVSYKATDEHWRALSAQAEAYGISPHLMARVNNERILNREDEALLSNLNFLAERIAAVEELVKKLREDTGADLQQIANAIQYLAKKKGGP